MKVKDFFDNWTLESINLDFGVFSMEFTPQEEDKAAAWALYVELLTRITTQPLNDDEGDEVAALESVHSLFAITREILKQYGRKCREFTGIAIVVLNEKIRPFAAKWHKLDKNGFLATSDGMTQFRDELKDFQLILKYYASTLSKIAGVEDLTGLINPMD